MEIIFVRYGVTKMLKELFGTTQQTVNASLTGVSNSDLAHDIRKQALAWGGVVNTSKLTMWDIRKDFKNQMSIKRNK